jgi:hypothetical protein
MIGLIAWCGTLWGRVAVGAGIIATLAAMWFGWLWHHDNKVESRVISKIERRNSQNVEKAQAARRSVQNIPADKLDDRYRRD